MRHASPITGSCYIVFGALNDINLPVQQSKALPADTIYFNYVRKTWGEPVDVCDLGCGYNMSECRSYSEPGCS